MFWQSAIVTKNYFLYPTILFPDLDISWIVWLLWFQTSTNIIDYGTPMYFSGEAVGSLI